MTRVKLIGLMAAVLCAAPISAFAQFDTSSGSPTTITADKADYQGSKTVLTGGVDVRQGDVRMLADKMTVFSESGNNLSGDGFSRIIAEGNFYYLTSDQEVRGKRGVYTKVDDSFVVTGDVILKQEGGNIVTGSRLVYDLGTQNARVTGSCKGRRCGSKGRVNILIKNSQGMAGNT